MATLSVIIPATDADAKTGRGHNMQGACVPHQAFLSVGAFDEQRSPHSSIEDTGRRSGPKGPGIELLTYVQNAAIDCVRKAARIWSRYVNDA